MKTYIFPGQGSQLRGMGAGLFEEFPDLTRQASDILGYSIEELCLQDPRKELNQTQFTQPAIYVVSALAYFKRIRESRTEPDMFAGHSLGEFNALMAAGCFDFELGLKLVKKRGELMSRVTNGGMAAIMNAKSEKIESILRERGAASIDITIYNSELQSVIGGPKDELAKVEPYFRDAGILYYPLNTSGAFHSRYIAPVGEEFRAYLANIPLSPLNKPVIANVTAQPYRDADVVKNIVDQLSKPVRWWQSMQYLLALGDMEIEEVGHGDVLTKLLHHIRTGPIPPVTQPAPVRTTAGAPASEKVKAWNASHPVGTKVRSALIKDCELQTRTEALVLFGHRAAIYLSGYNGYFDLDQLEVAQR